MDEFLDSFLLLETYLKLAVVLATYRLWMPVLRAVVREVRLASETPRTSLLDPTPPPPVHRPPGEDPWVSIPLASHRARSAPRRPPQAEGRLRGSVGKGDGGYRPARTKTSF